METTAERRLPLGAADKVKHEEDWYKAKRKESLVTTVS